MSIADALLKRLKPPTTFVELVLGKKPDPTVCNCERPITDLDVGDLLATDTDWCWRCRRSILEDDD